MTESNGATPPPAEQPKGIIPLTAETQASLAKIIVWIAPFIKTEQQAIDISVLIRDFAESAIRADWARLRGVIEAESDIAGWIEFPKDELITWLGLNG